MSRKKTLDEFVDELKNNVPELYKSIEIIGEYKSRKVPIEVRCKNCGYVWYPAPNNLLSGHSNCPCSGGKISKYTVSSVKERLKNTNWELVSGEIVDGDRKQNKFRCKKCGHIIETTLFTMFNQGYLCPNCDENARVHTHIFYENKIKERFNLSDDYKIIWDNNEKKIKTTSNLTIYKVNDVVYSGSYKNLIQRDKAEGNKNKWEFNKNQLINNSKYRNIKILNLEEVKNTESDVNCECELCKTQWTVPATSIIYSGSGCPNCSNRQYKLPTKVKVALGDSNINYEEEKSFDWLYSKIDRKSLLYIDIYVPEYNVAIECQGSQHYIPNEYYGGEKAFKSQQRCDSKKYSLCKKNGVKILYFTDESSLDLVPKKYKNITFTSIDDLLAEIKKSQVVVS